MDEFSRTLAVSSAAMRAQSVRLRHVSENISNADTPGYHRKTVSFSTASDPDTGLQTVRAGNVRLDKSELKTIFDPDNPLADASGNYKGSNVNLLIEMADAREARRSYDANLKMFEQARQMSSGLLSLLRK